MIVSWKWLAQYLTLDLPVEEVVRRLMMAGLNHESTAAVGDDLAIDLEVTSNRPDCLGHLGIAREIAVLTDQRLQVPDARPAEGPTPVAELARVRIECPRLCPRYTARVVRGLKVKPSPSWLVARLATLGIAAINNVVDISNYVLMECGQPLHTFDYAKLRGPEIVVRQPRGGETIEAIDHKTYSLEEGMCVIADARDAVAIGGVMGGAATEVSPATTAVLVESAEFDPISIRNTARRLGLHSDSSYRFERPLDPEGIDWASRRCCELILDLAGGELAAGALDVGRQPSPRRPIVLRLAQLKRILGIDVPPERVRQILLALGNVEAPPVAAGGPSPSGEQSSITVVPPSWRRDLTREIDLVEEVARIDGYENIPEDVGVPMAPSARSREDRVLEKVRQVLMAAGVDEALTLSAVEPSVAGVFSPWTQAEPLRSLMPVFRRADTLRVSLVPSLLGAWATNEALANEAIELFEIAKIYLPQGDSLPREEPMLGIISNQRDYSALKGVVEKLVGALGLRAGLQTEVAEEPLLDPQAACRLRLGGQVLGYVGQVRPEALEDFDVDDSAWRAGFKVWLRRRQRLVTVAELQLSLLIQAAELTPRYAPQSPYIAVTRDLNLVVDEAVRWADVAATMGEHGRPELETVENLKPPYREGLPAGKKSLLLRISLRSKEGTLTSPEADAVRDRIVAACRARHGAELRA
jgi:phenylalanyl-tRNA synthetase beta chain